MAVGIPTGFVRKLYRILDHESAAVITWDEGGASFSIHDSAALDAQILPRYFRGRLCAFRQQLVDHGFTRGDCEEDDAREEYRHPDFRRGQPGRLSKIERKPKRKSAKSARKPPVETISTRVETPKPQISLKVTLSVPPREGRTRNRVEGAADPMAKRRKTTAGQTQQVPAKLARNPLFSDEPEPGAMSLAKFVEGTGFLPASSDLPDPISYLSKTGDAANGAQHNKATTGAEAAAPMFSDDMVKSALFFLVSSSCTGVESDRASSAAPVSAAPALPTAVTTSTTGFLASLLASSSTGGTAATSFAKGSNPLFSDQTMDGEEDSIWNILVSSSVDRVRSAIGDVQSPQEKLRLILEEREKLEEQRKKVGAPTGPIVPRRIVATSPPVTGAMANSRPQKQQNPLFATDSGSNRVEGQSEPAEDDLWKLLMSSSIDSFRRLNDMGL
ncbi:transcription factor Hsr1 [Phytophthora pseudosyringae]|uniref:Transcription factor Hsr1 n=1 Tax=Phytophthora pseudosyringae TaxID=221518 RepID=A0A8T1VAD6_9STRA|nr:transcription factor Hsr1 [Phytophthora pseudosyringae]